ncbi:TonB family protein [Aquabacterium sp.]|uniref:cell envelope integrity protein TolA n=1 Tax=Aquabacterium sp. TaxID=1872578 RepID=UPI003BB1594A
MSAPSGMVIGASPGGRPREAERWTGPGLWLALGVHGLLLLALALSMNWKMSDPAPVEAEVWSEIPRVAGGAAPPPPPPREQPVVRRAPEPVKAADPEPEPRRAPDLVIAKTPPKKAEPRKPEPKKPEPRKDAPKVETVAKPSKATDPASRSLSAAELEAQRQANLQRMMSSLGGGSGGPGAAARSTGPSAGYAGRIIARIKPNIVFTESLNGNPQAVVEVRCAPDGRIMSRRLVSSSGVAAWDEAVLRALDRTEVLPADVDGRVPTLMQLSFKPRDF